MRAQFDKLTNSIYTPAENKNDKYRKSKDEHYLVFVIFYFIYFVYIYLFMFFFLAYSNISFAFRNITLQNTTIVIAI